MGESSGTIWVKIICLLPAPKVREALMCTLSFNERTWERTILAPTGQEKADMSIIYSNTPMLASGMVTKLT